MKAAFERGRQRSARPVLLAEDKVVFQSLNRHLGRIRKRFVGSRIGDLLVEEQVVRPEQLHEALASQKRGRGKLGALLVRMGVLRENDLQRVLRLQQKRRTEELAVLVNKELRLGAILVDYEAISRSELRSSITEQKKTGKRLGEILVERGTLTRRALQAFLGLQQNLRKVVALAGLALVLGGCATGMNAVEKPTGGRGTDYYGTIAPVTPYETRYKKVREYLRTASNFAYEEEKTGADNWQLPEETQKKGKGDCEDKAIWLYSKLLKDGFEDVRLVVGKQREDSAGFHTWVAWYTNSKVYILDPTLEGEAWDIDKFPQGYYQPYYSFYREQSWRHAS